MSDFNKNNHPSSRKEEIDALFAELGIPTRRHHAAEEADDQTAVSPIVTELYDSPETEDEPVANWGKPVSPLVTELYDADETPAEVVTDDGAAVKDGKKPKKHRLRKFFLGFIPRKGDSPLEIVRKCICIVAVLVLIGSACVLLDDLVITPIRNKWISELSNHRLSEALTEEEANYDGYPAGILEKFKKSYYHNHDLIGWITYPSESDYWYGIDYAVMQRPGDNDYYLTYDVDKKENKNGSIFMDYRCDYSTKDSHPQITLIYGHNMRSGQMFASLNQLLDSLSMARCSPTFTFSSLYEENDYKVFAVFNVDTNEEGAYDFLNKTITTDEEFEQYVAEMRVRSWYNYQSVDVTADDDIVLLYTCSNTYQTTMGKSGRTIVAARKVRVGESPSVDTSTIVENDSAVMPKVWYSNKGLALPAYYKNGLGTTKTTAKTTAATKKTTAKTTQKTTTVTPAAENDDEYNEDEPEEIATDVTEATTKKNTTKAKTTQTTVTDETKPTEAKPTEAEPTETEPTETEPTAENSTAE